MKGNSLITNSQWLSLYALNMGRKGKKIQADANLPMRTIPVRLLLDERTVHQKWLATRGNDRQVRWRLRNRTVACTQGHWTRLSPFCLPARTSTTVLLPLLSKRFGTSGHGSAEISRSGKTKMTVQVQCLCDCVCN